MSRVCEVTGKKMITGNKVSHSNNKTKRKFYPNLQEKKFYIPEEERWVTLKVSVAAVRTINKKGISELLKKQKKTTTLNSFCIYDILKLLPLR